MKTILICFPEMVGYCANIFYEIGCVLKKNGYDIVYACASPYMERYRKVSFKEVGQVFYLSEFLQKYSREESRLIKNEEDYWFAYPSFVKMKYILGRHMNQWQDYIVQRVFFQRIFDSKRIDMVVSEPPSTAFGILCFQEAQKRGVPFFGYICSPVGRVFNVCTDLFCTRMIRNPFPVAREDIVTEQPIYMSTVYNRLGSVLIPIPFPLDQILSRLFAFLRIPNEKSIETGHMKLWQFYSVMRLLQRKMIFTITDALQCFQNDVDDDYEETINILYPLQFPVENTSYVHAREYSNDEEIIRNISFSISDRYRLYVKEHPAAVGMRDVKFFRRVRSFPNVRILHPTKFHLRKDIQKFDIVVTKTSTVGFEALQKNIPVILLGRTYYENYPGVYRLCCFRDLGRLISGLGKANVSENKQVLEDYLQYCFVGIYNEVSSLSLEAENIRNLVKPIELYFEGLCS